VLNIVSVIHGALFPKSFLLSFIDFTLVPKTNTRIVHEAALYYAAYKLVRKDWGVEVKPSGEKGADLVIYDRRGMRRGKRHTVKVKGLQERHACVFEDREDIETLPEYVIVVRVNPEKPEEEPEVFVLDRDTVKKRVQGIYLEVKDYEEFKDRWELIKR
jgi:hypothetical protein